MTREELIEAIEEGYISRNFKAGAIVNDAKTARHKALLGKKMGSVTAIPNRVASTVKKKIAGVFEGTREELIDAMVAQITEAPRINLLRLASTPAIKASKEIKADRVRALKKWGKIGLGTGAAGGVGAIGITSVMPAGKKVNV